MAGFIHTCDVTHTPASARCRAVGHRALLLGRAKGAAVKREEQAVEQVLRT